MTGDRGSGHGKPKLGTPLSATQLSNSPASVCCRMDRCDGRCGAVQVQCRQTNQQNQPASATQMRPRRVLIGRLPAGAWCFETLLPSRPLGGRFRWGQGCGARARALWPTGQWDRMGQKMEGTRFWSRWAGATCWSEKEGCGRSAACCVDCSPSLPRLSKRAKFHLAAAS
jgi:hypothetical protein